MFSYSEFKKRKEEEQEEGMTSSFSYAEFKERKQKESDPEYIKEQEESKRRSLESERAFDQKNRFHGLYGGMDYDEVQKTLTDKDSRLLQPSEREYLEKYGVNEGYAKLADYDKEIANKQSKLDSYVSKSMEETGTMEDILANPMMDLSIKEGSDTDIAKADDYLNLLSAERNKKALTSLHQQYDDYKYKPDFWQNAKKDESITDDENYAFINMNEEERNDAIFNQVAPKDYATLRNMTPYETSVYNYKRRMEGEESANDYIESMRLELDKRESDRRAKAVRETLDEGGTPAKVVASIASIPANLMGNLAGALDYALTPEKANPYDLSHAGLDVSQNIRSDISEDLAKEYGNGVALLYQTGMSIGDSALTMAGFGRGADIVLGMSAAQQRAKDLMDQGASKEQILSGSILAGAAEALFERVSIDRFFNTLEKGGIDSLKKFVKTELAQTLTEGSEELFTDVANAITDQIVRGNMSDLSQMKRQIMEADPSMSEDDADIEVAKNFALQLAESFAGGALSGGVMGAVSGGLSYNQNKNLGSDIKASGLTDTVLDKARSTSNDEAFKATTKALENYESDTSDAKLGALYQTQMADSIEENERKAQRNSQIDDSARIDDIVAENGYTGDKEKAFRETYKNGDIERFADAFDYVYTLAQDNFSADEILDKMNGNPYVDMHTVSDIYKMAVTDYETSEGKRVDAIKAKNPNAFSRVGSVSYDAVTLDDGKKLNGVDISSLDNKKKKTVAALGTVMSRMGVNVHFYETTKEQQSGKEAVANGFYDEKNNTVYVDVNAGVTDKSIKDMIVPVASHEITHSLETRAVKEYNILARAIEGALANNEAYRTSMYESLTNAGFTPKSNSMEDLLSAQAAKQSKTEGRARTENDAMREIVARACEDMLTNSDLVNDIMAQIDDESKGKVRKIIDEIIESIQNFLNEVFSSYKADSAEAVAIRNMQKEFDAVKKMWDDALSASIENSNEAKTLDEVGVKFDEKGEVIIPSELSVRTWEESDYVKKRDEAAKILAEKIGCSIKKATKYIDDINSVARMVIADAYNLDYEELADAGMLMDNSEYEKTVDSSTLCKKRLEYTDTLSEIQRRLPNTALTADEMLKVLEMMQDKNYTTPCALCYVESTRKQLPTYAKEFLSQYKGEYVPNMAEINTPEGLMKIRAEHRDVYDAYVAFMNKKGQAKPKLFQTRAAYQVDEISNFFSTKRGKKLVPNKQKIEKFIRNGGLRLQSYSDFEVPQLIDMMQVIMDMSKVGMTSQAYTKVPAFAEVFGGSGVKINCSLIAKEVDKNGNLIFDDVEGMDHNEAFRIRDKYSDNVGAVCVVFDDSQLHAALTNPSVDYVLPFHLSSWKMSQAAKATGQKNLTDFTHWQNEFYTDASDAEINNKDFQRYDKLSKIGDSGIKNYMPMTYWNFKKDGRYNANKYLDMCNKDHRVPKFYQLLDYTYNEKTKRGTWSLPADEIGDNYFKLLIDFKMYNNEGVGAPQKAVKPIYDMEVAAKILADYKGDHRVNHAHEDIVDEFVDEYKKENPGVRYSARDSEGNELSKDQQKYFENSKVRDDDGNLLVLYHGTRDGGFSVFNPSKSDDGISLFTTSSLDVAKTYADKWNESTVTKMESIDSIPGGRMIYPLYANITNPLIFDGDNASWNMIHYKKGRTIDNVQKVRLEDVFDDFNRTNMFTFLDEQDAKEFIKKHDLETLHNFYLQFQDGEVNEIEYNGETYDEYEFEDLYDNALEKAEKDYKAYQYQNSVPITFREFFDNYKEYGWIDLVYGIMHSYDSEGADLVDLLDSYDDYEGMIESQREYFESEIEEGNLKEDFFDDFVGYVLPKNGSRYSKISKDTTRTIARDAKKNGHDGVILKNIYDAKDGSDLISDIVIAFDPNQLKSIYNKKPTSDSDIRFSSRDAEGNELTNDQVEFFKDSKMRDDNGLLKPMYHGSRSAGFTVFNPTMERETPMMFFTDRAGVAASYSGTTEEFVPDKPMKFETLQNAIESYFHGDRYAEKDGSDVVIKDLSIDGNDTELYRGSLKGAQNFFIDSIEDLGGTDREANYKVYLNLANPLVIDAKGKSWYSIPGASGEKKSNTSKVAIEAYNKGYDGVIFYNIEDNGGKHPDGMALSTVAIAFDPSQVKSVYNEHPTDDDDIRYSFRETYEDLLENRNELKARNAKLEKDVERLTKRIEILKEAANVDKKLTGGRVLSKQKIEYVANSLIKDVNSTIDKEMLVKTLSDYYNWIAKAEDVKQIESEVLLRARTIAEDVIEKQKGVKIVDDYAAETLKELKGLKFSLTEEQEQELKNAYGSNFRTQLRNMFTIDPNAKTLDSIYDELAMSHPELFDADTAPGDQVIALVNAIDDLKESKMILQKDMTREFVDAVADEIYKNYWKIDRIETTADKYQQKINKLNAEHRKEMEDLKKKFDSKTAAEVMVTKDRYERLIKKLRERGRVRVENYRNRLNKRENIERIHNNAKTLMTWIATNSKEKHVPDFIKKDVASFLSAINFSSNQYLRGGEETRKDLQFAEMMERVYNSIDSLERKKGTEGYNLDIEFDLPANYAEDFKKLVDTVKVISRSASGNVLGTELILNKMSLEELKNLNESIKVLKSAVSNLNKMLGNRQQYKISDVAGRSIDEIEELGERSKHVGNVSDFFNFANTLPAYFFKSLGQGGRTIFRGLQDGWAKLAFDIVDIEKFTKDTYKPSEVKEWSNDVKDITVVWKEKDGTEHERKFKMTVPQIMSLYCLDKREQAKKHIFAGGIRVGAFDANGKKVDQVKNINLSQTDVNNITSLLTDRQKEVADELQRYMNTVTADWGNEVTMARWGIRGYTEDNYFPIKSDDNSINTENQTGTEGNDLYRLLNMSFTKQLVAKADNQVIVDDIFNVFANHTSDMAKYHALALPVLDAVKWYNYKERIKNKNGYETKTVKAALEHALGGGAKRYVVQFLKDLNGKSNYGAADGIIKFLTSKYKMAAVAFNLRVALLQPTSYVRALNVLHADSMTKALTRKPAIKEMQETSGIGAWKKLSLFDTNVARDVTKQIRNDESALDKIIEVSMKGAEFGDEITWGVLWNACKEEIRNHSNMKESDPRFMDAVSDKFDDVVYYTQVVDSTMTRSQLMRDKSPAAQALTAFKSEPTVTYNMLLEQFTKWNQDARKHGGYAKTLKNHGKAFRRTAMVYALSALAQSLVESLVDWERGDEDDTYKDEFVENMINEMSLLDKLPLITDIKTLALEPMIGQILKMSGSDNETLKKIFKTYSYGQTRMEYAVISDFVDAFKSTVKTIEGEASYKNTYKILRELSQASGIPVGNAFREVVNMWNTTVGNVYPALKISKK